MVYLTYMKTTPSPFFIAFLAILIVLPFVWYFSRTEPIVSRDASRIAPRTSPSPAGVGSVAYFAGGCFWSMEYAFEKVPGVNAVISGYAGGRLANPTYDDVNTETTGHREAIEVWYDPTKITYRQLVEYYFTVIDPVDTGGQFVDRGESYTTGIFYMNPEEEAVARNVLTTLSASGAYDRPIVTPALPFTNFYAAEEYHQDFAKKNPARYGLYKSGSGRIGRTAELCSSRESKGLSCVIPAPETKVINQ